MQRQPRARGGEGFPSVVRLRSRPGVTPGADRLLRASSLSESPAASLPVMESDFGIKGFLETSFLDWPGRLAAVVFLGGCNFRCPFCHNAELVLEPDRLPSIPLDTVIERLRGLRGWVDGIVVSGGEPTLSPRLSGLLGRLRAEGFEIKLDTNGSCPDVLAKLIARRLVQAIDMDLKAPLEPALYAALAGVPVRVELIRASIDLICLSGLPHRFRTTYVPGLLDQAAIGRLRAATPPGSEYVLQGFNPKRVLDPALRCVAAPAAEELLLFHVIPPVAVTEHVFPAATAACT